MAELGASIEDDLNLLDIKIKQLKNEYEQYFLGSRKREPQLTRGDVQKIVSYYANVPIKNTGLRFRFNNLRSRFFSFKRHWDQTVRKIEEGTYERHLFIANLRERERHQREEQAGPRASRREEKKRASGDLFEAYRTARQATGQGAEGLTREKMDALLRKQEAAIRERYGVDEVRFRVVVEDGRAKLKASPVRG